VQEIIERLDRIESALRAPAREYLDTEGAAEFVGLSKQQLELWRTQRQGPRFVKIGRAVRYAIADLRDFMGRQIVEPLP
jgi:hypothetical protein